MQPIIGFCGIIYKNITVVNNKKTNTEEIIPEIKLKEELLAPIVAGDIIGTIK